MIYALQFRLDNHLEMVADKKGANFVADFISVSFALLDMRNRLVSIYAIRYFQSISLTFINTKSIQFNV